MLFILFFRFKCLLHVRCEWVSMSDLSIYYSYCFIDKQINKHNSKLSTYILMYTIYTFMSFIRVEFEFFIITNDCVFKNRKHKCISRDLWICLMGGECGVNCWGDEWVRYIINKGVNNDLHPPIFCPILKLKPTTSPEWPKISKYNFLDKQPHCPSNILYYYSWKYEFNYERLDSTRLSLCFLSIWFGYNLLVFLWSIFHFLLLQESCLLVSFRF